MVLRHSGLLLAYPREYIKMSEISYFAGLFDGEGSVRYKCMPRIRHERPNKPVYNTWEIRLEIAMTDKKIIDWVHKLLGVGTANPRKVKEGRKPQWRWICRYRDAYHVAKLLEPYSRIKLGELKKIINHYKEKK